MWMWKILKTKLMNKFIAKMKHVHSTDFQWLVFAKKTNKSVLNSYLKILSYIKIFKNYLKFKNYFTSLHVSVKRIRFVNLCVKASVFCTWYQCGNSVLTTETNCHIFVEFDIRVNFQSISKSCRDGITNYADVSKNRGIIVLQVKVHIF